MTEHVVRVAKVLDSYTVALTAGENHGVLPGMVYVITSDQIVDPETKEILGRVPKVRVRVTEVFPRFCIAETYRLIPANSKLCWGTTPGIVVNIGDVAELFYDPQEVPF